MQTFTKQPNELLDYEIDFSDWLSEDSDTIASVAFTADNALVTIDSSSHNDNAATVWLDGGADGDVTKITCEITTNVGRVKEVDFKMKIKEI